MKGSRLSTLKYFSGDNPRIFAHRGLAHPVSNWSENTIGAFRAALRAGATHLETDVRASSDGVAVLFHDASLTRLGDSSQKVSETQIRDLQKVKLPPQGQIPSLAEALEALPNARFNLDIKSDDAVLPAVSVIEQLDAHDRVLVSSFSERRRLATLELLSRPVATSAGSRKVVASYISAISGLPWLVERLLSDVDALQLPTKMRGLNFTNPRFIEAVIRAKCEIHYWTINDSIEMNQLIQMGATGIVTDRSDLLGVS